MILFKKRTISGKGDELFIERNVRTFMHMNKLLCRTIQACMHPENGIIIKEKGVFEAKERLASFRRCYCILFNTNLYVCSGASPL